jgi:O-antigen/teichoic acid export membrane protein
MIKKIKNILFKNTSLKQTVFKNTFWIAVGVTTTKLARAFIIIYVARILGKSEYGIFTYAMSIVAIFMFFSDLGLTAITTRELSKTETNKSSFLSTAFFIKLFLLVTVVLLVFFFSPLITKFEGSRNIIMIISGFVAIEGLRGFLYSITRSQNKMQVEAILAFLTEIVSTLIIIGVFLQNPSPKMLAYAYLIGNGVSFIATIIFLWKDLRGIVGSFTKSLIRPIFNSAWPFAILGVFGILMTNIDSVMIGFWNESETLGLYAAAQRPITLLYIIPSFLSSSIFPIISRLLSTNRDQLPMLVGKSYRTSIAIAFPMMIGGIILAGPIISTAFGQEYIAAVLTFQILLATLPPMFLGEILSNIILAEDKQKIFLRSSIIGAVTNVGLNFLLIPKFSIVGSAIATVIAQIISNGILYHQIKKTYFLRLSEKMFTIITASIFMGICTFGMKMFMLPLILIIPVSILIYFTVLLTMKEELILDIRGVFSGR